MNGECLLVPVYNYCNACHSSFKLGVDRCGKCGEVVPKKGKNFLIVVTKNKRMVRKIFPNSLTKARDEADRIKTRLTDGTYDADEETRAGCTLAEAWERYHEDYSTRGKPKSVAAERNRFNQLLRPRFGTKLLTAVTPTDVDRLKIDLSRSKTERGKDYAPKTILHAIQLLSRLFRFAARRGDFHGDNPCDRVTKPKVNNVVVRYLDEGQIKSLLETLDRWPDQNTANFVRFLIVTGIRRGEAFNLEWRDVDLTNMRIHLRDPKGGVDQYLPLNASAQSVLRNQQTRVATEATALVFPSPTGVRRTYFQERWQKIKEKAGLSPEFRVHDLRHNFASWLASSGTVDIYTLQALMTHKDTRVTQRYAHLFPNALKAGAEAFDVMLEKAQRSEEEEDKVVDLEDHRRRKA